MQSGFELQSPILPPRSSAILDHHRLDALFEVETRVVHAMMVDTHEHPQEGLRYLLQISQG